MYNNQQSTLHLIYFLINILQLTGSYAYIAQINIDLIELNDLLALIVWDSWFRTIKAIFVLHVFLTYSVQHAHFMLFTHGNVTTFPFPNSVTPNTHTSTYSYHIYLKYRNKNPAWHSHVSVLNVNRFWLQFPLSVQRSRCGIL